MTGKEPDDRGQITEDSKSQMPSPLRQAQGYDAPGRSEISRNSREHGAGSK